MEILKIALSSTGGGSGGRVPYDVVGHAGGLHRGGPSLPPPTQERSLSPVFRGGYQGVTTLFTL